MNTFSKIFGVGVAAIFSVAVAPAFVFAAYLSIQSLSPGMNIVLGTTVSFFVSASGFSNPIYRVDDSFSGSSVSNSNINGNGNFSWTPGAGDMGTHLLTVGVTDAQGNNLTVQQQITITPAPSISLQSLYPGSSVSIGKLVSWNITTTGFTNPTFSVSDSRSGSTISNGNINNYGSFIWTPQAGDVGMHAITTTVNDALGHSASVNQNIAVSSVPTAVIKDLSPGSTIGIGTPFSFSVTPSDFLNPTYTVSDSYSGGTVSKSNIDSSGHFSWTPTSSDSGLHTIDVFVKDEQGHIADVLQQVTVQKAYITLDSISPASSVKAGLPLTLAVKPVGFTKPLFKVNDFFLGSTISSANLNVRGEFSWTPTPKEIGKHLLTFRANDSYGESAEASVAIDVVENVSVGLTAPSLGSTVAPGVAVVFTAYTYGFNAPKFSVNDSFTGTSVSNGSINPTSGLFSWVPKASDAGSHPISVSAFDSSGHTASAEMSVVVLGPVAATPSVTSPTPANTFKFKSYLILGSTGKEVSELQKRLTGEGVYTGPISGYFGSLTRAAVKAYQQKHGIDQAGVIGKVTRAALNK